MRHKILKWVCGALVLVFLGNLALMGAGLRVSDEAAPLPHRSVQLSAESGPSNQGGGSEDRGEEATEPTEPTREEEPTTVPRASTEETVSPTERENTGTQNTEPTEPQEPTGSSNNGSEPASDGEETSNTQEEPSSGNREPSSGNEETTPGGDHGGENGGGDGPEDDDQLRIVTDLADCSLTFNQLTDDELDFYAYIVNGERDMYLRVKIRNTQTSANGKFLTASGRNYQAKLARQESNFITLYIKQGSKTILEKTYVVRYVNRQADENTPSVGEHPPTISTNLDGFTEELTNRNFTFLVKARTYGGKEIYADHVLVTMDGKTVSGPTGSSVLEYELYFKNPVEGDKETHEVAVLAWDDEGNSAFVSYRVTYSFVDTGGVIGTAYIMLDATVVGLDPWTLGGSYSYAIKQNEPASYAVKAMLEDFGYEMDIGGSLDEGFYLRRIYRGGLMDYGGIPEALWNKILADGLGLTGQSDPDSLGEFDYTQGAGWMYTINGTLYAGKGLSNYYLSDGDTLYLRFTLAYGKDIGGYNASGGSYGVLPTYCGAWVNGGYYESHTWGEETTLREPTCDVPGAMGHTCSVCGETKETTQLPALGHEYVETGRQEPTEETPGWIEYTCTRCGQTYQEPISNGEGLRRMKREENLGLFALYPAFKLRNDLADRGLGGRRTESRPWGTGAVRI